MVFPCSVGRKLHLVDGKAITQMCCDVFKRGFVLPQGIRRTGFGGFPFVQHLLINDFADREFDPHVRRTASRPLARGVVSPAEALAVFAVLGLIALALLFITLSTVLWLFTTLYAIGYLEGAPHRSRFFGFFSLCVTATMGIAMAGNLFTFFVFYELLTLSTFPLVVHRGTEKAMRAGTIY